MRNSAGHQVRDLLLQRDFEGVLDLCESDRRFRKALESNLYETDEEVLWPTIEALGRLARRRWDSGREEQVREYLRTLLWSLNEESGGIGWNSPQAIAEIIAQIPELVEPYARVTISRALEEPPLVPSGLWAIGRLGPSAKHAAESFRDEVLGVFRSSDTKTLGLAAWAMGEAGFPSALPHLEKLRGRMEPVRIWMGGRFEENPLGKWATEAITRITCR
ncbi:MAG: hypothetical protein FJZ95_04935 [Chloroflexi bacterium]|nr:hypothetical protein [Chloroflexota bacterium]